jgi:type IV pilus assembly protein PilM
MLRLTRAQAQPIGVDIGHDSIKLLQLQVVGNELEVIAAAKQAIPEELRAQPEVLTKAVTDIIRQMLRHQPFVGRNIVTALPRGIVHVKNLRLPLMPAEELEAAVQFEAKNIFPFETDDAYVRFLPAGEVRQGTDTRQEVIVLAAKQDDIEQFIETIHRCGVLDSLDFEPCAIYRGIERFIRRREDEQEVHVLVDVGLVRSQVIIGKGRDISFVKPIDIGGRNLNEAVARKLGISIEEARNLRRRLAETGETADAAKKDPVRQAVHDATRSALEELGREISLCLRYYSVTFRGQRPNRVRLVGGEACDPQLHVILNSVLAIPAEPARPLRNASISRMKATDRTGLLCEWSVAFGLGLKKTTGYFGSPDGAPRAIRASTGAEVIDLSSAMESSDGSGRQSKAVEGASAPAEVSNA